jgi:hypothetical protein
MLATARIQAMLHRLLRVRIIAVASMTKAS